MLHRLHYETSQYKENANLFATGCEAVTSMNRSQLYLWKSSKKKSMDVLTLSSLQTFESRMTMDVNQRKILVDEVQKIERNGVYDVRNALSARFIPEGILSLRATIIPSRFGTLWLCESGCSLHSWGEGGTSWPLPRTRSYHCGRGECTSRKLNAGMRRGGFRANLENASATSTLHYRPLTRFHNYY